MFSRPFLEKREKWRTPSSFGQCYKTNPRHTSPLKWPARLWNSFHKCSVQRLLVTRHSFSSDRPPSWLLAITSHQEVTLLTDRTRSFVLNHSCWISKSRFSEELFPPVETQRPLRRRAPTSPNASFMRRRSSILFLFVLLGFGVSLAVSDRKCAGDRLRRIGGTALRGHSSVLNCGAAGGCPDSSGGAKFLTP